jgi:hypothetical protein
MTISILGIDIAKNSFQLHGAGQSTTPPQTSPASGNSGSQTLCIASSGSTGTSGESLVSGVRLYRKAKKFSGRYDCSIQEKYGVHPGVETPNTPDEPGDLTLVRGWKVFAHREIMPDVIHDTTQYANNRAEQSHESTRVRERGMRGPASRRFKSVRQAQRFLGAHAAVYNLFNFGRHLVRAEHYRNLRVSAFSEWSKAVA